MNIRIIPVKFIKIISLNDSGIMNSPCRVIEIILNDLIIRMGMRLRKRKRRMNFIPSSGLFSNFLENGSWSKIATIIRAPVNRSEKSERRGSSRTFLTVVIRNSIKISPRASKT
jgi:hypothetical protein